MDFARTMTVTGLGLLLSAAGGLAYDSLQPPRLEFTALPPAEAAKQSASPQSITFPSLQKELPIVPGGIKDDIWTVSDTAANHLVTSATPGSHSNIVIYGHDSRHIFGSLADLSSGEQIHMKDADGLIHKYIITNIFITTPDDINIIQPTSEEILTVYTCTGFANSKRLIVQAKPIER